MLMGKNRSQSSTAYSATSLGTWGFDLDPTDAYKILYSRIDTKLEHTPLYWKSKSTVGDLFNINDQGCSILER